jgi:hypothetical protein
MPFPDWENAPEISNRQNKTTASARNCLCIGAPNSGGLPERFAESISRSICLGA